MTSTAIKAVIGAGFGDEGKGKVVSHLCATSPNPVVVRFCGGHQAGHRVVANGKDHIFSNFGSGTLHGAPTYWSRFCTIYPTAILNEWNVLRGKDVTPILYIDGDCPVTTPYDVKFNQVFCKSNGTCGVGYGATLQREADYYSLLAQDLLYPEVTRIKLNAIQNYYFSKGLTLDSTQERLSIDWFIEDCARLVNLPSVSIVPFSRSKTDLVTSFYSTLISCSYQTIIFEGAQGLMLDQNIGFFPNVTRGNTTTKNIIELGFSVFETYLVTRTYQTRHGRGPMTGQSIELKRDGDHNTHDEYQGNFRCAVLDADLLKYAINKDPGSRLNPVLVVTHADTVEDFVYTRGGIKDSFEGPDSFALTLAKDLSIDRVMVSDSPEALRLRALDCK